jgi:hypothetical protein
VNIRFQPHAVWRMQQRNLSVEEVLQIIQEPDGKIAQSKDKTILYKKLNRRSDNLVAAVVVERMAGDLLEVVTVLVNFEVRK